MKSWYFEPYYRFQINASNSDGFFFAFNTKTKTKMLIWGQCAGMYQGFFELLVKW